MRRANRILGINISFMMSLAVAVLQQIFRTLLIRRAAVTQCLSRQVGTNIQNRFMLLLLIY